MNKVILLNGRRYHQRLGIHNRTACHFRHGSQFENAVMSMSERSIVPAEREQEAEFLERMRWHHYLGAPCKIGRSAYYAFVSEGRWVAWSSFNASVLKSRTLYLLAWLPRAMHVNYLPRRICRHAVFPIMGL
ncbi:MAG: hypothetical protein OXD44_00380 [Gammaproteobacteria bacterium]|nr:hypothetical protein [Gammaproteobacteria bacterium]